MDLSPQTQSTQSQPPAPPVPAMPARPGATTGDAAAQGEAVVLQPPPYRSDSPIPPEVLPIVQTVFGSLIAIAIGVPLVRFVTRILEKRMDRSLVKGTEVARQMQQLQQSLDAMAIEIERIGEAQRFQAKLMAERERAALPEGRGGA